MIWVILTLFWIFWAFCIYRWLFELSSIDQLQEKIRLDFPKVSVVIACKNEFHLLKKNIQSFLNQDYPDYELIIVDDQSEIPIKIELFKDFDESNKLKLLCTEIPMGGKKNAIKIGIENASGTWIALSDADCRPVHKSWIRSMMKCSMEKDVIVGFSPYSRENKLLNKFIQYETLYIAIQYFSAIQREKAYMAVGRNLYLRKSLFYKLGGFEKHLQLLSGIDDLFIRDAVFHNARIGYSIDPNSLVISEPKKTLRALFNQKLRHISSSFFYSVNDKRRLVIAHMSHIGLYICLLILLFFSPHWSILLGILIYWMLLWFRFLQWSKSLFHSHTNLCVPFMDIVLAFYYATISIFVRSGVKKW